MGLKDLIFDKYIQANNLEKIPDFSSKKIVYTFPDGLRKTQEEIISSPEYAGFSDGFQDLPRKVDRATGTLLDSLDLMAKSMKITGMRKALSDASGSNLYGYNTQYNLGKNCSSIR